MCLNVVFLFIYDVYIYTSSENIFENISCQQCSSLVKKTLYLDQSFITALQKCFLFSSQLSQTQMFVLEIFDRSTDQVCFHFRFCKMGAHCNPEVEKRRTAATDRFMFISLICSNICLVR